MTRKPTIARGAVIERSLVKRKLRREKVDETWGEYPQVRDFIDYICDWLDQQPKRTARKGGIGR